MNREPLRGFQSARPIYSDDVVLSRRAVASLHARLRGTGARTLCTAHAKCAPITEQLWRDVQRE